jgi:hypothetical protein
MLVIGQPSPSWASVRGVARTPLGSAFKDLVGLAADDSERRAELYVLGPRPIRFLRETHSTARWALNKSTDDGAIRTRFGSLDTPISAFVNGPSQAVAIMDLEQRLPHLFDLALDGTSG